MNRSPIELNINKITITSINNIFVIERRVTGIAAHTTIFQYLLDQTAPLNKCAFGVCSNNKVKKQMQ